MALQQKQYRLWWWDNGGNLQSRIPTQTKLFSKLTTLGKGICTAKVDYNFMNFALQNCVPLKSGKTTRVPKHKEFSLLPRIWFDHEFSSPFKEAVSGSESPLPVFCWLFISTSLPPDPVFTLYSCLNRSLFACLFTCVRMCMSVCVCAVVWDIQASSSHDLLHLCQLVVSRSGTSLCSFMWPRFCVGLSHGWLL